jgi:hypothetical protein
MQAWERPLANLRLDGHPACGRTLPITTDPEPITFQDQRSPLSSTVLPEALKARYESSTGLEIIDLRCLGNCGDVFAAATA